MTGSTATGTPGAAVFARIPGIAGLLAPLAWAAASVVELAHANIGHSLIARPERLFNDSAWHWPLVVLVAAALACVAAAAVGLLRDGAAERKPRLANAALAVLAAGLAARLLLALLLPADPHGYTVSPPAMFAAYFFLLAVPFGLFVAAAAIRRLSPGLAWLSAGTGIVSAGLSLWAMVWSIRSAATNPELLAVEPTGALLAVWAAVAGARQIGWPAAIRSGSGMPPIPAPGRKSAAGLATVLIAVVGVTTASFVRAYQTTVSDQLTGKVRVESIHADTVDRTYRVYRPAGELARPGLVIVLHGSFGDGFQAETNTGFDAEADRLGWISAYPDGIADGWDAFGSGPTWGRHPGADDLAFMRVLVAQIERTDNVDPDRVYVTGHSRGGMMTYRLGCEMADIFAAVAPVSGNMATATGSADVPCHPARPISILATHGTADGTIPMAGGKVDIVFSPMADVIARWRTLDGCDPAAATDTAGGIATTTWSCAAGTNVTTRIIAGGCHCWSGGDSRAVADFFVAHPRTRAG